MTDDALHRLVPLHAPEALQRWSDTVHEVSLRYTDHIIERVRLERYRTIASDPNPFPHLRIWRWWPTWK